MTIHAGRRGAKALQRKACCRKLPPECGVVGPLVTPEIVTDSCIETLATRAETTRKTRPAPIAEASLPTQDAPTRCSRVSCRSDGFDAVPPERSTGRTDRLTPVRSTRGNPASDCEKAMTGSDSHALAGHTSPRRRAKCVCSPLTNSHNRDEITEMYAETNGFRSTYTESVIAKQREVRRIAEAEEFRRQGLRKLADNGMPAWARAIVAEVADRHGVFVTQIAGKARMRKVVAARNEAAYLVKAAKPEVSALRMSGWFGRDHTTILFALASHAEKTGAPRLTTYNLALARRRNAANQSSARKRARQNGGQN